MAQEANVNKPVVGDFDYETLGQGYAQQRRADPRIAAVIHQALGNARTVLNVGAGAGSYEPEDRIHPLHDASKRASYIGEANCCQHSPLIAF